MKFEQINVNLSGKDKMLLNLKGLLKDLTRAVVIGLVGLGILFYLYRNLDVYLFTAFHANEVRKAIVVHDRGEQVRKAFIDEVYSKSIK